MASARIIRVNHRLIGNLDGINGELGNALAMIGLVLGEIRYRHVGVTISLHLKDIVKVNSDNASKLL